MRSCSKLVATVAFFCLPLASWAEGPDEQWEMTMSVQTQGMSMPAMTQKVCKKAGASEESQVPMDKDCKLLDSKRSGSQMSFSFVCDSREGKLTGNGESELLSKDSYRGKMHTTGTRSGENVDMNMEYSGQRVGTCTWEDPAKRVRQMQAQGAAALGKECDRFLAELDPRTFFGAEGIPAGVQFCKDRRPEFCASTARVAQQLRDPAGYAAANGKYRKWRAAMTACGTDPTSVIAPVCKAAVDRADWSFATAECGPDVEALRKARCDGRVYSQVEPAWRDMCSQTGGVSYTAKKPDPAQAVPAEPAAPSTVDKLKDGAGKLRKFLKF